MRYLMVKEAAVRVGVSEATVYNLCRAKKLRHLRLGTGRGTIRIPEDALEALILGVTVPSSEGPAPSLEEEDPQARPAALRGPGRAG